MTIEKFRPNSLWAALVMVSIALAWRPALAVDCSISGTGIQAAVNAVVHGTPTTIVIEGICTEDVTVTKDDITFEGSGAGDTVAGTFTVNGARRVTFRNLVLTGSGSGIIGTDGATLTVENCVITENDEDGIQIGNGAHANILNNIIASNGNAVVARPNSGLGVQVYDSGTALIVNNKIIENLADGIGVFNDGYARVEENVILRNGLTGSSCGNGGCGVQVSRAIVRANGNKIVDNGHAAVGVYNHGVYRTGTYLSADRGNVDNLFPFEVIAQGNGDLAVEVGRYSFLDVRQVNVQGTMNTFSQGFIQVRGDNVGPDLLCSQVVGDINVSGNFSVVQLRATNVTGNISIDPAAALEGSSVCPPF